MKRQLLIGSAASVALMLAIGGFADPANAAPIRIAADKGTTSAFTRVSEDCEAALNIVNLKYKQKLNLNMCKSTLVTTVGDAKSVQVLGSDFDVASLTPNDFASLQAAVVAGTVKSRSYLQQANHLSDSETQSGIFYYDGTRAWVTSAYRGFTGSHRCAIDWTVGYSISLQGCYESGSTSERTLSQQWLFTPFVNGFPVSWSETYSIRVNASGQVF